MGPVTNYYTCSTISRRDIAVNLKGVLILNSRHGIIVILVESWDSLPDDN